MSILGDQKLIAAKTALVTAMVAASFSAFFIAGPGFLGQDAAASYSHVVAQIIALLTCAFLTKRAWFTQRVLFLVCLTFACVTLAFTVLGTGSVTANLASGIATGALDGLFFAYSINCFRTLSDQGIRIALFTGTAAGMIAHPFLRAFIELGSTQIGLISILLFLLCAALFFLLDSDTESASAVHRTSDLYTMRGVVRLIIRRRITGIFVGTMLLFSVCYGVLEICMRESNHVLSKAQFTPLIAAALFLLMLVFSIATRGDRRFVSVLHVIGISLITISLFAIALIPYGSELAALLTIAFALLNVFFLIISAMLANRNGVRPSYICCILAAALLITHSIGRLIGMVAVTSFSSAVDALPRVASLAVIVIALASIGAITYFSYKADRKAEVETEEPSSTSLDTAENNGQPEKRVLDASASDASAEFIGRFESFCERFGLSEREREVMQLYAQGNSVRAIAPRIHLSETTIRSYIQHVYTKTGLHNKQEIIDAINAQ